MTLEKWIEANNAEINDWVLIERKVEDENYTWIDELMDRNIGQVGRICSFSKYGIEVETYNQRNTFFYSPESLTFKGKHENS